MGGFNRSVRSWMEQQKMQQLDQQDKHKQNTKGQLNRAGLNVLCGCKSVQKHLVYIATCQLTDVVGRLVTQLGACLAFSGTAQCYMPGPDQAPVMSDQSSQSKLLRPDKLTVTFEGKVTNFSVAHLACFSLRHIFVLLLCRSMISDLTQKFILVERKRFGETVGKILHRHVLTV